MGMMETHKPYIVIKMNEEVLSKLRDDGSKNAKQCVQLATFCVRDGE